MKPEQAKAVADAVEKLIIEVLFDITGARPEREEAKAALVEAMTTEDA